MKYVLITGAAGLIGTGLRENFKGRYRMRLSDIRAPEDLRDDEEFVPTDIRDFEAVQGIVDGVDAVVHMGGIASEDTWEAIRDINIDGTYNVFESARRAGAKRVVYASSVHAVGFYPRSRKIGSDVTVLPDSRYGVSKAFGEAIGALYANKYDLEVMAVRIGNAYPEPIDERRLSIWTSHRDLAQLIGIGLDHPDLKFRGGLRRLREHALLVGQRGRGAARLPAGGNAEDWAETIMATAPEDPNAIGADVQGGAFAFLESGAGVPTDDED